METKKDYELVNIWEERLKETKWIAFISIIVAGAFFVTGFAFGVLVGAGVFF